jgi:hypothetical protein
MLSVITWRLKNCIKSEIGPYEEILNVTVNKNNPKDRDDYSNQINCYTP